MSSATRVAQLPKSLEWREGDPFRIRQLTPADDDDVYRLVQRLSSQRARGYAAFGSDEFPTLESFLTLVESGELLVGLDPTTGVVTSFAGIVPSLYGRSDNCALADVFIAVDGAQARAGYFRRWVRAAVAVAMEIGYVTTLVQTFACNVDAFTDLRSEGFRFCATFPNSGRVYGVGLVDTVLLGKQLSDDSEVRDFTVRRPSRDMCWQFCDSPPPRPLPYVPGVFTWRDAPPGVTARYCVTFMSPADVDEAFALYSQACRAGVGYAGDELQRDAFRSIASHPAVVNLAFRDEISRELVAALQFMPATCCRSALRPALVGGDIVVRPHCAGAGLATALVALAAEISADLGYSGVYGETYARHAAMMRIQQRVGLRMIGCIPRTIQIAANGGDDAPTETVWDDTCVFYRDCLPSSSNECPIVTSKL